MYYGVCVGHDWLESMKAGDPYKRQLWAKLLQRKTETGIPYLFFKDNVNAGRPDVYKDKNMTIHAQLMYWKLCCHQATMRVSYAVYPQ